MAIAFSRTIRSLEAHRYIGSILFTFLIILLLGAWVVWSLLARVTIYEVSNSARLEVDTAVHPIEAPVSGRVSAVRVSVGQQVQQGDSLVELDAETEMLQLQEGQTQPDNLISQIKARRSESEAEERALKELAGTRRAALDEARGKLRETEASLQFGRIEAERLETLYRGGLIAELEYLQAKSEVQRKEATAASHRAAINRLEQEYLTQERDRQSRLERLKGEVSLLQSQLTTQTATLDRLEHEVQRRLLPAPTSGQIGEMADLRVGTFVQVGDKLGTIIPAGQLRIVADFLPKSASGRIRPGQQARLKLDGFPWSQYGRLRAVVTNVAREAREGKIRVELKVLENDSAALILQHGLPGTVEIEVEQFSPAILALRAAGQLLDPQPSN